MQNEIVMASAGSGKTYALSNRLVALIMRGVSPREIMALTFTRKAAGEFASALFEKMAKAALSEKAASSLSAALGEQYDSAQYLAALARLVAEIPRLSLGTLDGYFTRIVESFQAELGLSAQRLRLVEGGEEEMLKEELLSDILNAQLGAESGVVREFLQAFKAVQYGKEDVPVRRKLQNFTREWHGTLLDHEGMGRWGRTGVLTGGVPLLPWAAQAATHLAAWEELAARLPLTHKSQQKGIDQFTGTLEGFAGGAGQLSAQKGFFSKLLLLKDDFLAGVPTTLSYYKPIEFDAAASRQVGELLYAIASEELRVHTVRSEALWTVLCHYEAHYHEKARKAGQVTFQDIKYLASRTQRTEEGRLARELINYRLDGQTHHWLLDEFQDTSTAQWAGLEPLIDEVVLGGAAERSLFVVGDVKQSIYQWRGGCVGLFDHLQSRYSLSAAFMQRSWRSQKPVLDLVNTVCANHAVMSDCFGPAAARWQKNWQDHTMAEGLPERSSHAEIRDIKDPSQRENFLREKLAEMRPIERGLSCAFLLRSNEEVRYYAQFLRQLGYAVAEEGKVSPATDNCLGALLLDLLRWLHDPNDAFASRHLEMSPFMDRLQPTQSFWEQSHHTIEKGGLAAYLSALFHSLELSSFSQFRLDLLLQQLGTILSGGAKGLPECTALLEKFTLSVQEGTRVIEVMTIHQSKGLGFDVVFLPEISRSKLVNRTHFQKAVVETPEGRTLLLPPAQWVSSFFPPLQASETQWEEEQYYEGFCLLYVALTRAKRGLYGLIEDAGSSKTHLASHANWTARSALSARQPSQQPEDPLHRSVLYTAGTPDWYLAESTQLGETPPPLQAQESRITLPTRRRRKIATRSQELYDPQHRGSLERGTEMHRLLQGVEWLKKGEDPTFEGPYQKELETLFHKEDIHTLFRRPPGEVTLYREQAAEYLSSQGEWSSVVIDRFWTHWEGDEQHITILEYKSDRSPLDELTNRYQAQLAEYEAALRSVYGEEITIRSYLLSIEHQQLVRL